MIYGQRDINRKLRALEYSDQIGNLPEACRYFGISRDTFFRWKRDYHQKEEQGLINRKPCPHNPKTAYSPRNRREDSLSSNDLTILGRSIFRGT